ncbi:MAG: PilT/PilU family type 4a pilus ATPase [Candidatus Eisenbacteria bacterium]
MTTRIGTFLELAVNQGGSDLHLVAGQAPCIRIAGLLHRVRFRELSADDMDQILGEFMLPPQADRLREAGSVDFAYEAPGLGRFRVNAYRHARGLAAVLRVVSANIPSLDDLGLPPVIRAQALQRKGLTLVTGPTGSGKSTTLAAIVDLINSSRRSHVITIEDPIEYVHPVKLGVISQREIGQHASSFDVALRDAVREDPDAILVGELRDLESIALALTAAETGIQVLATLHTSCASRTIDRMVNVFPARRQDQIRSMLAESLRMIVSQRLLRTPDGGKRVVAAEILVNTHAAATMIRTGNSHKLDTVIQAGGALGMQGLDAVLKGMVRSKQVDPDEAYLHAVDRGEFERMRAMRDVA